MKHAGLDFSGGWRTLNMLDLEKIDVAKERARVQAGLPPIDDPTQLAKRRAMMQEHEQNEWGWRDQELQVENDTQMDLLREGLALHVEARAERTDQVLDGVAAKADAIAQRAYDKTSQRGVVEARENAKRRDAVYNPVSKTRNIIDEYANPGSDVYAPRTRLGHKRPVGVAAYEDVVPTSTKDSEQLMHIEERLGRNMMYTGDDPDEMRAHAEELAARVLRKDSRKKVSVFAAKKTTEERRAEEYTKQLAKLESTMEKHAESKRAHQEVEPSIVEVVERPPERPPTPDIADLIAEEQEVDPNLTLAEDVLQAILFFQRILRGRASQNTMFEGAERRRGLIEELVQGRKARRQEKRRKKEQLAERGVAGGSSALMAPDQLEIARIKKAHQQQLLAGAIENIFGAIVANGLDYLSSDLVRTRELERLRNIAEQANAERRERITQEKIKRAEALERQRQRRAKYDRVMAVHRSMAELVVADLLVAAQEQIALVRVEEEMRAEAEEERRLAALPKTSGAVVNDLLFGWLLPHVENESKDTAATISEEQYFRAAASAMASTLQTLFPREGDIAPTPRPT